MTSIQIIALVLVVLSVAKMITLLIKPEAWLGNGNPLVRFWIRPNFGKVITLVLGAVVLKYLLEELSITQIFATTAFTALFFMLSMAPYRERLFSWIKEDLMAGKNIVGRSWLSVLIWLGLMVWVLVDIFG